jgi:hypothetical protein
VVDRIVIADLELHFQFERRLRLQWRRAISIIVAATFRIASWKKFDLTISHSNRRATGRALTSSLKSMFVIRHEHRSHAPSIDITRLEHRHPAHHEH